MKWLLITILATSAFIASLEAKPADSVVEIEKQRLVKFPDDDFRFEDNQENVQNDEAGRILKEIEKINIALGYVKKQPVHQPKYSSILDSNQYLYPKPAAYHPFHLQNHQTTGNGGFTILQPSIRNLNFRPRSTQEATYYLQPYARKGEQHQRVPILPSHYSIPVRLYRMDRDDYPPTEYKVEGYKIVGDLELIDVKSASKKKFKSKTKSAPKVRLFFLPQELVSEEESARSQQDLSIRNEKFVGHRPFSKVPIASSPNTVSPSTTTYLSSTKPSTTKAEVKKQNQKPHKETKIIATTTQKPTAVNNTSSDLTVQAAPIGNPLKTVFSSFFNRPTKNDAQEQQQQQQQQQQQLAEPFLHSVLQRPPSPVIYAAPQFHHPAEEANMSDDYKWDESSSTSDEDASHEKHIFGLGNKEITETEKHALSEGGIIIKRLKVRKGGIAIAGPGGIATAGSGGTAIVGPGGFALTHPRSLTIAGPGAKVIAIPETTDLKDALLQTHTDGRNFPREGKVVATGPTIYYSPDTSAAA